MDLNKEVFNKNITLRRLYVVFTAIIILMLSIGVVYRDFVKNNKLGFILFGIWWAFSLFYLVYEGVKVGEDNNKKLYRKNMWVIIVSICFAVFIYYIYYLSSEKFIRYWDYTAYWNMSITNSDMFSENMLAGLKNLIHNIFFAEHNPMPTMFTQTLFNALGRNKWAYILSTLIMYTIPVIICFGILFNRTIIANSKREYNLKLLISTIIVAFSSGIHHPSVLGYIDIVGVVFIMVILLVIHDYDFKNFNLRKMLIIAIALILLFITRRWYAYWIVGLFVALGISNFITDILIDKDMKTFISKIKNIFILGASLLTIVLVFFYPVVERVLKSNFSFAYSAYKQGGIGFEIIEFIKSLGYVPSAFMILGIIYGIVKWKNRNFTISLLIISLICIILLNQIQTMSIHHRYLILPSALYFQALGVIGLMDIFKNKTIKYMVATIALGVYIFNFYVSATSMETSNLFTNSKVEPISIVSYEQNVKLGDYIQEVYEETGERTYIVASSLIYNDGIIQGYYLPNTKMNNMLHHVYHIDLRDGFPAQFVEAKSVIVVDPIQYHMRPEDQRVIGVIGEALLKDTPVKKHYEVVETLTSESCEVVYLLKQISPLDNEALTYLINEFNKYYKEYPDLFENRIREFMK